MPPMNYRSLKFALQVKAFNRASFDPILVINLGSVELCVVNQTQPDLLYKMTALADRR